MLELREVETPKPRPDEVLIKVAAAGVNRADCCSGRGITGCRLVPAPSSDWRCPGRLQT